jgi:hypothetical protein
VGEGGDVAIRPRAPSVRCASLLDWRSGGSASRSAATQSRRPYMYQLDVHAAQWLSHASPR